MGKNCRRKQRNPRNLKGKCIDDNQFFIYIFLYSIYIFTHLFAFPQHNLVLFMYHSQNFLTHLFIT